MKLTGKFKTNKESYLNRVKELSENKERTHQENDEMAWIIVQLDILKAIEEDAPLKLRMVQPDETQQPIVQEVDIAKFNTPDKVTDTKGKEYQRVKKVGSEKIEYSLIFKLIGGNDYFIILKK